MKIKLMFKTEVVWMQKGYCRVDGRVTQQESTFKRNIDKHPQACCLVGAVWYCYGFRTPESKRILKALVKVIRPDLHEDEIGKYAHEKLLIGFNDQPKRTLSQIIDVVTEARV